MVPLRPAHIIGWRVAGLEFQETTMWDCCAAFPTRRERSRLSVRVMVMSAFGDLPGRSGPTTSTSFTIPFIKCRTPSRPESGRGARTGQV